MTLKFYNSLTKKKEIFTPLHEGLVTMYVCGPTVYDHPHIGHAKSYVSFDVIVRYLRYMGYKVRYVQNITDVGHLTDNADTGEDKILKRAQRERLEPAELVEIYTRSYFEDMDALNNVRPNISPRATAHIPEQIELVEKLIAKGFAYVSNGSVYFNVNAFKEYGKLSGRKQEELEAGARIEINPEKKNPSDFALWKKAEPGHIMRWKSPWGEGFPGWHLECSAMSMKYLGQTLDIHGGGLENIFPHHECEIAQSEAANELPFVRYWIHNNMVTVNGQKMGKSLGNFITLKDAFKKYNPLTVRFFILNTHYRSPLDFSNEALDAADKGLKRLLNTMENLWERISSAKNGSPTGVFSEKLEHCRKAFIEAMDEDINTSSAIAVLFDFSKEVNTLLNSGQEVSKKCLEDIDTLYQQLGGDILGIIPKRSDKETKAQTATLSFGWQAEDKTTEDVMNVLIDTRNELRKAKQWQLSDFIRNKLSEIGIALDDKPDGTTWKKAK
ncbi:MAG: cysteine--tRNA ligase [Planctomycetia bacterium]|uniref:cysteine--tRNA ligase n=1 Tax=Candidatus Brocadia sapporoensis TaxID=392547 RepID=UPI0008631AE1|nr:cysteine--tRNA ligase [Candidatus Brocadia sapporoensis]MCC7239993.1 cysteine--tRNA ligase [Candidatus Brocadia sp.]QOJ06298.1 MAG: cysteine--tRNA ligase [Planctomycetia bacterium]TVL94834.1 MAG: cysteine--tRNA ligase [Candidatus Brocadia sp. BL1]MDG6006218.1 cysteine--tRNA ligase [Candidatus Brocadia sp.]GJQ23605.1 MAG: cysteine--tRNA ligase [Candidatus Brocadia sapporoensis]